MTHKFFNEEELHGQKKKEIFNKSYLEQSHVGKRGNYTFVRIF